MSIVQFGNTHISESDPKFEEVKKQWREQQLKEGADLRRTDLDLQSQREIEAVEQKNKALTGQLDLQRKISESGRASTEADIAAGRQVGRDILGEEGLGRLGTDKDVAGVLDRYKSLSETGMSSAESLAKKEQIFEGIGQATQTAERGLLARLGSRGVRGAAAGAQLAGVQVQGLQQRAGIERDIFLEGESIKRGGLKDFAEALGQVKTFDLSQAAREKDIELSAGLGFGQLGQAERSALAQAESAKAAAAAQASSCFIAGTQVRMVDGSFKNIEDIALDDVTSVGKVYGVSCHKANTSSIVSYDGIGVVKSHPVYEEGVWMAVGDSKLAVNREESDVQIHVFDLWVQNGRIEIKGKENKIVLFTDYEGIDVTETNKRIINELNGALTYETLATISKREVQSKISGNKRCL